MDSHIVIPLLMEKLQNLLNHEPTIINSSLRDAVQTIINQLNSFRSFLKFAEDREMAGHPMGDQWMARLLNTIYSAEYTIDTFITNITQLRQRNSGLRKLYGPFTCVVSLWSQILFANEMHSLTTKVRKLSSHDNLAQMQHSALDIPTSLDFQNELRVQKLHQHWEKISGSCLDQDADVVGFGEQVNDLVAQLIPKDRSNRSSKIIALVGDGGSGKTTLARIIYNNADIKRQFNLRSWVQLSEDSKTLDIVGNILKQLYVHAEMPVLEFEAILRLRDYLRDNWSLTVMDDVETTELLEKLRIVFSDSRYAGRVIVTTRKLDVALHCDSLIKLGQLTNEDSWALFLKKVCMPEDSFKNAGLINLKDQILKICNGLPLAIILMVGLLSTKDVSYQAWSRVIEHANIAGDVLTLSYQDLPSSIKPCFLYMGLFPKAFKIPVRRLFQLWIVEGFVSLTESCSDEMVLEDLLEIYFKELVCRNMVEISRWRPDGSPKICFMPRVLYDVFSAKAIDVGLFNVLRKSCHISAKQPKFSVRRLVAYSGIKNHAFSNLYLEHLHTFVSFNTQRRGTSVARELDQFFSKFDLKQEFRLLKVLDLEGVYRPTLPDELGEAFRFLSYLGLRSTALDSLPMSVRKLSYLETLDVKHTFITTLPISICKAKNLKHLYLNWIHLDMSNQDSSFGSLTKLQTLWGLSLSGDSPILNCLEELTSIRQLGLTCLPSAQQEAIADWISQLTKLQSLMLRSTEESGKPSELKLRSLDKHHKLLDLYLLGYLPSSAIDVKFLPPNLKVLTLSMTQLKEDPMPMLGQLPHLNILRLLADSYLGKKITCQRGGFPQLRVLKLWNLRKLEQWIVLEGALPCLRKLEIRQCYSLQSARGFKVATLEEVALTNMGTSIMKNLEIVGEAFIERNSWQNSLLF